jgi:hypothetical protein
VNRLPNRTASIARLIVCGGTLALLAMTAVGCGHHHPSATGDHTTTEAKSNTPHSTASSTTNTPATPGGTFVGRCPKVIAATCVPGIRYERGPNVICVNRHGNKATARTPTPQDLARLKKQAPEAEREFRKTRKLPYGLTHPPSQLFIRRLPNGSFYGICEWGGDTPAIAAENAGNY